MSDVTEFNVSRGSDFILHMKWPIDLRGFEVYVFEPSREIVDAEITDAENGEVSVSINWKASHPPTVFFRIGIAIGEDDRTTQKIKVAYQ